MKPQFSQVRNFFSVIFLFWRGMLKARKAHTATHLPDYDWKSRTWYVRFAKDANSKQPHIICDSPQDTCFRCKGLRSNAPLVNVMASCGMCRPRAPTDDCGLPGNLTPARRGQSGTGGGRHIPYLINHPVAQLVELRLKISVSRVRFPPGCIKAPTAKNE